MRTYIISLCCLVVLIFGVLGCGPEQKKNKEKVDSSVSSLYLSADGRAIVDDQGRELAKLQKGFSIRFPQKDGSRKLPGHMECEKDCVRYDSNGKCLEYYTSCTWVWD